MTYDAFISHASEDKPFVRPLAEALRAERLSIWYDEFELTPGSTLRASLDKGLRESRFGIVVLSEAFFGKAWPEWELDGIVQLVNSRKQMTILPLWYGIDHDKVAEYSASLANIVAIRCADNSSSVAAEIVRVLRPKRGVIEIARDTLLEFGFPAPRLSDDWWLEAAAATAPALGEGTFQEYSAWGWWGFPLPPLGSTNEEKADRLAWAAMQKAWQDAAVRERLSQCTKPDRLLDFIDRQPGLAATAESEPDYLLCYAPQLGIPGSGGVLEEGIAEVWEQACDRVRGDPCSGAPGWILRDSAFCGIDAASLADRYFWPTDPAGTSPDASVLGWIDATCWILSNASTWLPKQIRDALTQGLLDDETMRYTFQRGGEREFGLQHSREFQRVVCLAAAEQGVATYVASSVPLLLQRITTAADFLELPEEPQVLLDAILSLNALERYWYLTQEERHRVETR